MEDDPQQRLDAKLSKMREQRGGKRRKELKDNKEAAKKYNVKKPDQKKLKKQVKSQKIDDILRELNIHDPDTKNELIAAWNDGRIRNVNDLSSWLALHAPLSQVRPQDVLAVRQASKEADEMAKRMTERIDTDTRDKSGPAPTRHIRNPREVEKRALDQGMRAP